MAEFKYEVKRKIGAVEKDIELRVVSWGGYADSYDLRKWYVTPEGDERCAKGITFNAEVGTELTKQLGNFLTDGKAEDITRGRYSLKIQKTKYGYDVATYNGDYRMKGVTFTKEGLDSLWKIMYKEFISDIIANEVEAPKKKPVKKAEPRVTPEQNMDSVVHALSSLPVNDGNYPIKTATIEQLQQAIEIMKDKPGNKTRLTRCEAKLKQLEKQAKTNTTESVKEVEKTEELPFKIEEPKEAEKKATEEKTATKTTQKKADIIQFPKQDTTEIKKLVPTGENHTYEEAEVKLNKEKEMFKGDHDSEYVIDGILEHCVSDQEFLDNVMRPEKSYVGAMQYFMKKAQQGYCMRVGNIGVMSADTALKYAIDYFNSEEEKKPEPKTETKEETKKETKKTTTKKSAPRRYWKRGGYRR